MSKDDLIEAERVINGGRMEEKIHLKIESDWRLIQRVREGDMEAHALISSDFDHKMGSSLKILLRHGVSYRKLIAQRSETLLRCIDNFDPSRGQSFQDFAAFWFKHDLYRMFLAGEE